MGFSEIDKYAIKSYCAIHNVDSKLNLGDITKIEVNKLPRFIDLITHGSPCQDFSIAGKQAGAEKGSGTRSSLMWNTIDIVEWCLPKYVIWENVKNILSKKHKHNFDSYIEIMDKLGYNSYYQVLNAKDYEIPQNRERIYTISIRKDLDNNSFKFPEKQELKLRLKDMLEDEVEEKYYLNEKGINYITKRLETFTRLIDEKTEIAHCPITAEGNKNWTGNFVKDSKCIQIGKLDIKGHDCVKRVYSQEGISPTLTNMQGGNRQPKIEEVIENKKIKIRKLTPKECWRLMGFSDDDFKKAEQIPTSNTQLYKQAGNSIVVKVLEKIFLNLFKEEL